MRSPGWGPITGVMPAASRRAMAASSLVKSHVVTFEKSMVSSRRWLNEQAPTLLHLTGKRTAVAPRPFSVVRSAAPSMASNPADVSHCSLNPTSGTDAGPAEDADADEDSDGPAEDADENEDAGA